MDRTHQSQATAHRREAQEMTPAPQSENAFPEQSRYDQVHQAGPLRNPPPALRRTTVPGLQRIHGNAFVQRLLRRERQAAAAVQRQPREEVYPRIHVLPTEPENDPAALPQAERVEHLFDLYAIRSLRHRLPGTEPWFGRSWIWSSAGSGLIREEIRRRLITKLDRPELRQWFLDDIDRIEGPEVRKRELRHMVEDVFESPSWRPADQIPIDPAWPAWKQRYATLWNEKGQLFADLAAGLDPDIEPYVIAGITAAESGQTYFRAGRAVARFEAHVFWNRWGATTEARQELFNQHFTFNQQEKWKDHRWRQDPSGSFQPYHGDQNREWAVLEFARTLDADAHVKAVESASFGAGQTMGFNYARAGFGSAIELLEHYQTRERAQVEGIVNYIATITPAAKKTQVINGIKAGNFLPLSQAYGPANPQAHAQRIANAVDAMRTLVEAAATAGAAASPGASVE